MMHVWVVEMLDPDRGKYDPCCSASLTKEEGLYEVKTYRKHNPSDKFRLRKYVPEEKP